MALSLESFCWSWLWRRSCILFLYVLPLFKKWLRGFESQESSLISPVPLPSKKAPSLVDSVTALSSDPFFPSLAWVHFSPGPQQPPPWALCTWIGLCPIQQDETRSQAYMLLECRPAINHSRYTLSAAVPALSWTSHKELMDKHWATDPVLLLTVSRMERQVQKHNSDFVILLKNSSVVLHSFWGQVQTLEHGTSSASSPTWVVSSLTWLSLDLSKISPGFLALINFPVSFCSRWDAFVSIRRWSTWLTSLVHG